MAPVCSRAAFRLLVSILLFTSIANAARLPHYALDPRSPLAQVVEDPPELLNIATIPASDDTDKPEDENIWAQIARILHTHDIYRFFHDSLERLLGERPGDLSDGDSDDDDDDETVTTTVYITPTPIEQSSAATIEVLSEVATSTTAEPVVTPPGPLTPSAEPTPASEDVFSILPVGPLTTAINATLPDPELASSTSILEPSPSQLETVIETQSPVNSTAAIEPTLTPASITDIFSANPPSISLEAPWSGNASTPTINQVIPSKTSQPIVTPGSDETVNATSTTLIVVTATVVASPIEETGTGVITPVSDTATLMWPNTTIVTPSAVSGTIGVSAATGISNATASAIETPLFPNTTFVIPTLITVTGGPGSALNVSIPVTIPPFANTTYVLPTPISGTGSRASAANASDTISNIIIPTTIPGSGSPGPTAGTISNAPIPFTEIPYFSNVTVVEPTAIPGTGTAVPVAETASSEPALEPNVTALYSTTTTTLELETPTPTPAFNDTDVIDNSVEFPGLLAFRRLCQDPQIRVITLPLLNRFFGPSGYPSLFAFPGCVAPNSRQATQAPGLLNCTALGVEVQRCQASGRKVFLSVKGDDIGVVGGNARFGDPESPREPFGPYFVDANAGVEEVEGAKRRQVGWVGRRPPTVVAVPEEQGDALVVKTSVAVEPTPEVVVDDPVVVATLIAEPLIAPEPSAIEAPPVETPAISEPTVIDSPPVDSDPSAILEPSIIIDPLIPFPTIFDSPPIIEEPSTIDAPPAEPSAITLPIPIIAPYPAPADQPIPAFPNLFDTNHPPSALALTLFSLFGEGHTERVDLRPLGPDALSAPAPTPELAANITSPDAIALGRPSTRSTLSHKETLTRLSRPLGESVVVDGYDVQLPAQWKGTYQEGKFKELVGRLRQLNREAWKASGGVEGGKGDLGADGRPEVYWGWVGEMVRRRKGRVGKGSGERVGWVEWDGR